MHNDHRESRDQIKRKNKERRQKRRRERTFIISLNISIFSNASWSGKIRFFIFLINSRKKINFRSNGIDSFSRCSRVSSLHDHSMIIPSCFLTRILQQFALARVITVEDQRGHIVRCRRLRKFIPTEE